MSVLTLRILAVIFMLIDHVGFLLAGYGVAAAPLFRIVGRLSFPIFAFLIANGYRHTHSKWKYALRLLVLALVSEIPFDLMINKGRITLYHVGSRFVLPLLDNVCFTLLLGLLFLYIHDFCKKKGGFAYILDIAALLVLAQSASLISADYGRVGVLLIAAFGVFDMQKDRERPFAVCGLLLFAFWDMIFVVLPMFLKHVGLDLYAIPFSSLLIGTQVGRMAYWRIASVFALPLLLAYNGKENLPKRPWNTVLRVAFYAFYPVHLLLLYILRICLR